MKTLSYRIILLELLILLLCGCINDGYKKNSGTFILPNGEKIINPTVNSFNEKFELKFEAYLGIYFDYYIANDRIRVVLYTEETMDINNMLNVYNDENKRFDDVFNSLQNEEVLRIGLSTFTPQEKAFWDSLLIEKYSSLLKCKLMEYEKEGNYYCFCNPATARLHRVVE